MIRKASDCLHISKLAQSVRAATHSEYHRFVQQNECFKHVVDSTHAKILQSAEQGRTHIYCEQLPLAVHAYFLRNGFHIDNRTISWDKRAPTSQHYDKSVQEAVAAYESIPEKWFS
jgi:hypothetical protein